MYLACSTSGIIIPHMWGRVNTEMYTKYVSTAEYLYLLYFEKKPDFDV